MALYPRDFVRTGRERRLDGTSASTLCIGNDSRLSDARTPVAHGLLAYSATPSTVANTASETNFTGSHTFAANAWAVGHVYRGAVWGVYGTDALASTTLRLRVKAGSTVLGDSTAKNNGLGVTNRGWQIAFMFAVTAIGAAGTIEFQGTCGMSTTATATGFCDLENTAAITLDTTATQQIQISCEHQNADADNTATMRLFMLERIF